MNFEYVIYITLKNFPGDWTEIFMVNFFSKNGILINLEKNYKNYGFWTIGKFICNKKVEVIRFLLNNHFFDEFLITL